MDLVQSIAFGDEEATRICRSNDKQSSIRILYISMIISKKNSNGSEHHPTHKFQQRAKVFKKKKDRLLIVSAISFRSSSLFLCLLQGSLSILRLCTGTLIIVCGHSAACTGSTGQSQIMIGKLFSIHTTGLVRDHIHSQSGDLSRTFCGCESFCSLWSHSYYCSVSNDSNEFREFIEQGFVVFHFSNEPQVFEAVGRGVDNGFDEHDRSRRFAGF
mmetsp:Transcript_29097/g.78770  ORF Transcript_29097/g.78770 Transcript_29097/m.78770 type:complete len:215 (+) Transcript_29097:2099-2743(+)